MKTKIPFIRLPFRVSKLSSHYLFYNGSVCKVLNVDSKAVLLKFCDTGDIFEVELFDLVELVLLGEVYQCDYEVEEGLPF